MAHTEPSLALKLLELAAVQAAVVVPYFVVLNYFLSHYSRDLLSFVVEVEEILEVEPQYPLRYLFVFVSTFLVKR